MTRIAVHRDTETVAVSEDDGGTWTVCAPDERGRITPIELDAEGMALDTDDWVEASLTVPLAGDWR